MRSLARSVISTWRMTTFFFCGFCDDGTKRCKQVSRSAQGCGSVRSSSATTYVPKIVCSVVDHGLEASIFARRHTLTWKKRYLVLGLLVHLAQQRCAQGDLPVCCGKLCYGTCDEVVKVVLIHDAELWICPKVSEACRGDGIVPHSARLFHLVRNCGRAIAAPSVLHRLFQLDRRCDSPDEFI